MYVEAIWAIDIHTLFSLCSATEQDHSSFKHMFTCCFVYISMSISKMILPLLSSPCSISGQFQRRTRQRCCFVSQRRPTILTPPPSLTSHIPTWYTYVHIHILYLLYSTAAASLPSLAQLYKSVMFCKRDLVCIQTE